MAKQTYQCNICQSFTNLYKNEDISKISCHKCQNSNFKKIFNFQINQDDNNSIDEVGELTQKYIEENKIILENLKKEKMEWKSR